MSGVLWEQLYAAVSRARQADRGSAGYEPDSDEHPCTGCGRVIGSSGRWYSDGASELVPYCAECAERQFKASGGPFRP